MKKFDFGIIPRHEIPPLRTRPYTNYDEIYEKACNLRDDQALKIKCSGESHANSIRKAVLRRSSDLVVTSRKIKKDYYVFISRRKTCIS